MKFKILLICSLVILFYMPGYGQEQTILYISDNIVLSNSFDTKYIDMLQSFVDDDSGKGKIHIRQVSRFDINTTECFEFLKAFNQRYLPRAVILMAGEANYHNLYGFSAYIKDRDKHKTKQIGVPKSLKQINEEMAVIYGVKNPDVFTVAYKHIMQNDRKDFKPKVIPDFYALKENFAADTNIMALMETYRHAWTLIREQKFDDAKEFLNTTLEKKPGQSSLYYALGSLYLIEQKENCEKNALKAFENGILVNPFDKENLCYKGLVLLFMMYKGEITAEVLYFARLLNSSVPNISDEISAITTINTPKHEEKSKFINNWVLYDVEKIRQMCIESGVSLILSGYPAEAKINGVINNYAANAGNILFFGNVANKNDEENFMLYRLAKEMYLFLKKNAII